MEAKLDSWYYNTRNKLGKAGYEIKASYASKAKQAEKEAEAKVEKQAKRANRDANHKLDDNGDDSRNIVDKWNEMAKAAAWNGEAVSTIGDEFRKWLLDTHKVKVTKSGLAAWKKTHLATLTRKHTGVATLDGNDVANEDIKFLNGAHREIKKIKAEVELEKKVAA